MLENNFRHLLVGTSIALSSLGLSSATAQENSAQKPQAAPVAGAIQHNEDGATLAKSTFSYERNSGALSGTKVPTYDGPVLYEYQTSAGMLKIQGAALGALAGATLGAIAAATSVASYSDSTGKDRKISPILLLAGIGVIGGIGGSAALSATAYKQVTFETTVSEAHVEAPHFERVPHGKTYRDEGPFFLQLISIPESSVPLAANTLNTHFIPGQRAKVTFYLDKDNHIVSWTGEPGTRPMGER